MNKIYDQFKKIGKRVAPYALAGALAIGSNGCKSNIPEDKVGNYAEFEAKSLYQGEGNFDIVLIDNRDGTFVQGCLSEGSGLFSRIEIGNQNLEGKLDPNHKLWNYANPESLKVVHDALRTK